MSAPSGSPVTAPNEGASARRSSRDPTATGRAAGVRDARAQHQPDRAEADDGDGLPVLDPGDLDPVETAGERLGQRRDLRRARRAARGRGSGTRSARARGAAPRTRRSAGGRGARTASPGRVGRPRTRRTGPSWRRRAAARRDVDPADLVPERARQLAEQHGVSAAVGLEIGAVGQRDLDLEEDVAVARNRVGRRPRAEGRRAHGADERPHGVKTTFSASRRRKSSSPSANRSSGSTIGSGTSRSCEQRRPPRACTAARPSASPTTVELAPVDVGRRDRAGVGEDEHGAARGDGVERRLDPARPTEHGSVDRPVGRRPRSPRVDVDREHLVARAARARRRTAARRTRSRRRARDRAGRRAAPRSTQASGSTIVPRQSGQSRGQRRPSALRRTRSARPARPDRRLGEPLAGRLVAREAALALAAGRVVDERHAAAVVDLRDDLVAEHRAGVRRVELLDVGAAEPAGDDRARASPAVRLGHVARATRSLAIRRRRRAPPYPRAARAPRHPAALHFFLRGAIAQLGERLDRTQEVGGSSPPSSISSGHVRTPDPRPRLGGRTSRWNRQATCLSPRVAGRRRRRKRGRARRRTGRRAPRPGAGPCARPLA